MKRAEQIDIIVSTDRLRVDNHAGYKTHIPLLDLDSEDFVTVSNLDEFTLDGKPSVGPIIVTAGTPMPIVASFSYGITPIVNVLIRGASNMFQLGSGRYELYYSDPVTCTNLVQVWIYGNDDGTGHLNEDIMYSIVGNV